MDEVLRRVVERRDQSERMCKRLEQAVIDMERKWEHRERRERKERKESEESEKLEREENEMKRKKGKLMELCEMMREREVGVGVGVKDIREIEC